MYDIKDTTISSYRNTFPDCNTLSENFELSECNRQYTDKDYMKHDYISFYSPHFGILLNVDMITYTNMPSPREVYFPFYI